MQTIAQGDLELQEKKQKILRNYQNMKKTQIINKFLNNLVNLSSNRKFQKFKEAYRGNNRNIIDIASKNYSNRPRN